MIHGVFICRIHKGSPGNVAAVIPNIKCDKKEKVIYLDEVQRVIGSTYGKRFKVQVVTIEPNIGSYLNYEVEKSKAILKL